MSEPTDPARDRERLRRRIRQKRERMVVEPRRDAARRVAANLSQQAFVLESRHVAGYHAIGGELDPLPALESCRKGGASAYLPVLDPDKPRTLRFREWTPDTPMNRNRLGIPEPSGTAFRDPRQLDLVLVPLVVCDRRGYRLGMGGGYYDATFAWRIGEEPGLPLLVGMAYEFQIVERLATMPWDVPLDHLATPKGIINCRRH